MTTSAFPQSQTSKAEAEPSLVAATSNGNLLRFLQGLSLNSGWTFHAFLSGESMMEALAQDPPRLVVLDVFLDEKNGFDLRGEIRLNPQNQLAPIMLVAPGCSGENELSERLEISRARFEVVHLDEALLSRHIHELMSLDEEYELQREKFRYSTFIQVSGEVCHAANQPLTSLICNLELAMHAAQDDTTRQRLKISHESALKIMRIIQAFQRSKRQEERDHVLPIYIVNEDLKADLPVNPLPQG